MSEKVKILIGTVLTRFGIDSSARLLPVDADSDSEEYQAALRALEWDLGYSRDEDGNGIVDGDEASLYISLVVRDLTDDLFF